MTGPGRPKYAITDDNLEEAINYLDPRLQSVHTWFDDNSDNYVDAKNSFKRAAKQLESLNTWCDKYLLDTNRTMMRNTINKKRSRIKNTNKHPLRHYRQVTLSTEARMMINYLAELEGKTYSEFLVDRFEKEFFRKCDVDAEMIELEKNAIIKIPSANKSNKTKAKHK